MSGHSKWSTIKRKKEKTDVQKAKIFTKIVREITVCVRENGADPTSNTKLRDLIAKAKNNNLPNENIKRVIEKSSGGIDKNNYETIVYEGYGVNGVAIMVECLTDNRNRTASDVRHCFDKFGGNLGTKGCVSFIFESKGVIIVDNNNFSESKIMEDCMTYNCEDFTIFDDNIEIITSDKNLFFIKEKLEKIGYKVLSYEVEMIPTIKTSLNNQDDIETMEKLILNLENSDDVQNIYTNLD